MCGDLDLVHVLFGLGADEAAWVCNLQYSGR